MAARMKASVANAAKLHMEFYYNRPAMLVEAMQFMDERTLRKVLKECERRKINLAPHIEAKMEKTAVLLGEKPVKIIGGRIRIPIHIPRKRKA
jgi:hypothetical protein